MKPVYESLARKFSKDRQWLRYFAAVYWSSARAYSEYRESKQEMEDLCEEFAKRIRFAMEPLDKLRKSRGTLPMCLREVRAPKESIRCVTRDKCFNHLEMIGLMKTEAEAPERPDALEHLSRLAEDATDPRITFLSGDVEAISSQKPCRKTELIRGLAYQLTQKDPVGVGPYREGQEQAPAYRVRPAEQYRAQSAAPLASVLLDRLRDDHSARCRRGETFALDVRAMARAQFIPGWSWRQYDRARKLLLRAGQIEMVSEFTQTADGRVAAQYRLSIL